MPAAGSLHGVGEDKEFAQGVGKDNRPLIASLADEIAALGDLPLPGDELPPHRRAGGDRSGIRRDLRRANQASDVLAVEQHLARRHVDAQRGHEIGEDKLIGGVQAAAKCGEGDGAVHRAGIEEGEPKPLRKGASGAAFACAGGTVNGDNHGDWGLAIPSRLRLSVRMAPCER